jgi:hypothetical protein
VHLRIPLERRARQRAERERARSGKDAQALARLQEVNERITFLSGLFGAVSR